MKIIEEIKKAWQMATHPITLLETGLGLATNHFGWLRAPVKYRLGATSHDGEVWCISPIASKCWWKATRWFSQKWLPVDTKSLERVSPQLWGEWWYCSGSPDFGWLSWSIAARRVMGREGRVSSLLCARRELAGRVSSRKEARAIKTS